MSKPADRDAQAARRMFFALGDSTRLALVRRLAGGVSLTATQLARGAQISRQAIVKHLRVLEDAGLVRPIKDGRAVLFALEVARVDEARAYLDEIATGWDRAIERLRRMVEARER